MRYLSVCSGIEAATVAWHPLGWEPAAFSEIEAFPRAVLQHHYPHVPLHGDFTTIKGDEYGSIDLLVGGTPCQSFSIAGKRLGLDDPRGNLSLEYLALAVRLNATWFVWENVPGVFSSADGDDFAAFISAATGIEYQAPAEGWGNAGIAAGRSDRYGIAWRVLDAQYFGVPQRRRRVFVIGYLGDWRPAAAVLFERESLRGDITPRRETGEGIAGTIGARTGLSSGAQDAQCGHMIPATAGTLCADSHPGAYTGQDAYSDRLIPWPQNEVSHTLRAQHDASEDGSGRGIPLVTQCLPINTQIAMRHNELGEGTGMGIGAPGDPAFTLQAHHHHAVAIPIHDKATRHQGGGREGNDGCSNGLGVGKQGDPMPTLDCNSRHAVAFDCKASASRDIALGPVSPTLRAMPGSGGGQVAVAFAQNTRDEVREMNVVGALSADPGMKQTSFLRLGMGVRRLTPRECERLQGFPDDYTLITVRGKPAADAPRYKSLGNSMARPVMEWIGQRIQEVQTILTARRH
jgi:DNA (cytosine-5)-methyltransferase 1